MEVEGEESEESEESEGESEIVGQDGVKKGQGMTAGMTAVDTSGEEMENGEG